MKSESGFGDMGDKIGANFDPGCLFCRIARKEIPAEVIYEDDATCAFLDVAPRAPGHTVIVPRRHSPTLKDVPEADLAPLFRSVQQVTRILLARLSPDGLTIGINQGRASGQTVDHLHIHVLPRYLSDGGGSIHSVVDNPGEESIQEIAKKIRAS